MFKIFWRDILKTNPQTRRFKISAIAYNTPTASLWNIDKVNNVSTGSNKMSRSIWNYFIKLRLNLKTSNPQTFYEKYPIMKPIG